MRISDWSSDVCSSDLRGRFLEDHADLRAQQVDVGLRIDDVAAFQQYLAGGALTRIQVVHAVENAQQCRLAAAGWADECGDLAVIQWQRNAFQRAVVAVEKVEIANRHFLFQRSEEHTSELQSLMRISYAVFCLKKQNTKNKLKTQERTHHE